MVVVRNTERVGSIGSKLYLFIHFIYKTTEMQQPYTSHCHGSATYTSQSRDSVMLSTAVGLTYVRLNVVMTARTKYKYQC